MRIIILATGNEKLLTTLESGKTLLGQQLENLARFVHLDRICVIVGYSYEKVSQMYPNINVARHTNRATAKSLLSGMQDFEEEDVLWLNGNVLFHPSVLHTLIAADKTGMVVNTDLVEAEEVKYRTDGVGRIIAVSKDMSNPKGESLGVNFFKADDADILKEKLQQCKEEDQVESVIEVCIKDGMEVWAITIPDTSAIKVDTEEDIDKANGMLARWNQGLL